MKSSWAWARNYRVWDANRKAFLFPENWIEPELRPASEAQFPLADIVKAARVQRTSTLVTSAARATALATGQALAAAMGRDLYWVDLGRVVSKYIGETEKNLDRVFTAAAQAQVVLLYDEADALFGKRTDVKDSHDRFSNTDVGYLLQRIEKFDGLVIVASNAPRSSSLAIARRFQFVVDVPADSKSS